VPKIISDSTPEIKSAFLRAFWDDEGCISNSGSLTGTTVSEKMAIDLIALHKSFGIICGVEKINKKKRNPCFRLIIRRSKENWQNFIENAGFEHGIITKGYNIGKHKKDILLEKFRRRYN
jgi:intein/homing endonuclease